MTRYDKKCLVHLMKLYESSRCLYQTLWTSRVIHLDVFNCFAPAKRHGCFKAGFIMWNLGHGVILQRYCWLDVSFCSNANDIFKAYLSMFFEHAPFTCSQFSVVIAAAFRYNSTLLTHIKNTHVISMNPYLYSFIYQYLYTTSPKSSKIEPFLSAKISLPALLYHRQVCPTCCRMRRPSPQPWRPCRLNQAA